MYYWIRILFIMSIFLFYSEVSNILKNLNKKVLQFLESYQIYTKKSTNLLHLELIDKYYKKPGF